MKFFGKKLYNQAEWEESPEGRRVMEKFNKIAEENARKNLEWESKCDPKRLAVFKNFKKVFPKTYIILCCVMVGGMITDYFWQTFIAVACIGLINLLMWFFPPKVIKNRLSIGLSCFAVVSSLFCMAVIKAGDKLSKHFIDNENQNEEQEYDYEDYPEDYGPDNYIETEE